ncbi:hypothetical protein QYM36_002740, partial [Artemia franciscana]
MEKIIGKEDPDEEAVSRMAAKVKRLTNKDQQEPYNQPFSLVEIEDIIRYLPNTAPGADMVYPQLVKNLPQEWVEVLLEIINIAWKSGCFPKVWKAGLAVMIPKPGKDTSKIENHRFITLLPVLGKVYERLVKKRLNWEVEKRKILKDVQCGFRRNKSTIDNLVCFQRDAAYTLQNGLVMIAVFLDVDGLCFLTMKQTDEEQIEKEAKVKNPLLNYLPQNSQEMVDLALKCKDWATMHGACMRSKINFSRDQLQYAPFAMLPSPFPRDLFEKACRLQPLINELMFSVAINDEFLLKTLERLVDVDPFLARLLRIYRTVLSEGVGQDIFLGLIRSDYMIEKSQNGEYKLSMVEVNTIAAGFGWMGPVSGMIHKINDLANYVENELLNRIKLNYFAIQQEESTEVTNPTVLFVYVRYLHMNIVPEEVLFAKLWKTYTTGEEIFDMINEYFEKNGINWSYCVGAKSMTGTFVLSELDADEHIPKLPVNNALEAITDGMHEAWMHYQSSYKAPSSVIMIIVEDVSYNICDQRFHEFELAKKNPKVRTIRRTLTQVGEQGWLDNSDSKSRLKIGETEVAVIYFRCGYAPEQYPTEKEWEARLLIERSLAIKCPSIRCHLAGSKKIQQILSKEGMIDTFLQSQTEDKESNEKSKKRKDDILALCDTFTGLYSLDL